MERTLTIKITGKVGSGKTTVATLVSQHLQGLGFQVEHNDPVVEDYNREIDVSNIQPAKIVIDSVQLPPDA